MSFFEQLTEHFYQGVQNDEVLRPIYPEDLGPSRRRLRLFLAQFWGGPRIYEDERGPAMLRARHVRWEIGQLQRDRWLSHMAAAVEASGAGPLERAQLLGHFQAVADHLMNTDSATEEGGPRAR